MSDLREFLGERAADGLLPWQAQVDGALRYGVSLAVVEEEALEQGILPSRYQRNRQAISCEKQLVLFRSRVAVIGCGGLGGYLVEQLARLGVGTLVLVDPDIFEEHNLNRQILSSPAHLGLPKVEVARERVHAINPAVTVVAHRARLGRDNALGLLESSSLALDGLDSIDARKELAAACTELRIPLVHGAIAGWYGRVSTQIPGEEFVPLLWGPGAESKGIEAQLGNPAFTPAVVASLQVAEACKVLTGIGRPLTGRMIFVNLHDMEMEEIRFAACAA